MVLALTLPSIGWSQSVLNFPLPVDAASGSLVGYAVVNPNTSAANVTFKVYSEAGLETGSTSVRIPAGGQVANLFAELFRNSDANGWVQATSSVSGLQGFTMGGDFTNNVDGAASADSASDQIFPFITDTTTIVVSNPFPAPLNLTMRFFTAAGAEITPAVDLQFGGHGWSAQRVQDLVGASFADVRYVRLTGAGEFVATAMVAEYLIAKPEFALYNGIDVKKAGGVLNFPHVVSGDLGGVTYSTALAVTNLAANYQTITLTFTPESGLGPSSIELPLGPGVTIRDVVSFPGGGFKTGWIQIRSAGPIAGVMAVVNADEKSAGIAVVQPQSSGATTMIFPHIANAAPWTTGLAFINPTQSPATVEVFAINSNGGLIGGARGTSSAQFTLSPGAKTARLLSELIPQTQAANAGFVFVRTGNTPIIGLELFTLRRGGPMANVPSISLPSGIRFTPPAP